jgi:HEAT repeat protein
MDRAEVTTDHIRGLVRGLDSADPRTHATSAVALGELRAYCHIHCFIEALFDSDPALSRWAATAGLRGDEAALRPLLDRLGSDEAWLREAAAGALGLLGHADSVEPLAEALRDPDPKVVRAAALSLKRLGDDRGSEAVHGDLLAQLSEGDQEERAYAARTLGALGDGRATGALVDRLADPAAEVRADAAEALGKIADKGAMHALLEAGFRDVDQLVRDTAMFALARMTGAPTAQTA